MPALTPEAVHAVLEDAFNRADLDANTAAYEPLATLVVPPEGRIASGRAQIRAATAPVFAGRPQLRSRVLKTVDGGGLALTHAPLGADRHRRRRHPDHNDRPGHHRVPPPTRRQLGHPARRPDEPGGLISRRRAAASAREHPGDHQDEDDEENSAARRIASVGENHGEFLHHG